MTLRVEVPNEGDIVRILLREPIEVDIRFRAMADEFRRLRLSRPFVAHTMLSLAIGMRAFGLSLDEVRKHDRSPLALTRQQMMTFCYVINGASGNKRAIARLFHRTHSNVIFAVQKYGDAMKEMIA